MSDRQESITIYVCEDPYEGLNNDQRMVLREHYRKQAKGALNIFILREVFGKIETTDVASKQAVGDFLTGILGAVEESKQIN